MQVGGDKSLNPKPCVVSASTWEAAEGVVRYLMDLRKEPYPKSQQMLPGKQGAGVAI